MRDDFAVFILTHGRPGNVLTHRKLLRAGYSGRIYLVVDDEDRTFPEYVSRFGEEAVLRFSKAEVARRFDEADNFDDRRAVFYARNVCFDLARQLGLRYFLQLDDDYFAWFIRYARSGEYVCCRIRTEMDSILEATIEFYEASGALTFCMSQGGDHIGGDHAVEGKAEPIRLRRKAMNTFLCSVDRPFAFRGRINEDVNTYTDGSHRGGLFLTAKQLQVIQTVTQKASGGMTETYQDSGTYVKTFYSVMFCPSAVKVGELEGTITEGRQTHRRIHHRINWNACAAKILPERVRKPSPGEVSHAR